MWVPWQVGRSARRYSDALQPYRPCRGAVKAGLLLLASLQEVSAVEHRLYLAYRATGPMEEDAIGEPLLEDVVGDARTSLYVLLAAVICLLLIACLNLSNLLVARSAARRRETAIRSALGGTRLSLMRQQVIESLLICVSGGTLGVLLAVAATRWLVRHWTELPRGYDVHPDGLAIGFALGSHCWLEFWRACCRRSRRRAGLSSRPCRRVREVLGEALGALRFARLSHRGDRPDRDSAGYCGPALQKLFETA